MKEIRCPVLALALVLLAPSCSTVDPAAHAEASRKNAEKRLFDTQPREVQTGIASFYGGRWIGRPTANGERYQPGDITAAHRSLPFNSVVRVTNLENNESVLVRINNRGPYIRGRIVDLSVEAARELRMEKRGIVPVKVEVLDPKAPIEEVFDYINGQRS